MMPKHSLGTTGMSVSALGLGTVKFGRNTGVKYPAQFNLPTDAELIELLACAKDLGINLLDTAPAYGTSEERLGNILQKQRHDWIVCSKAGEEFSEGKSSYDFSPQAIKRSVERSLQRLNTDFLDVLLIHSNGDDINIIEQYNVFDTLAELKRQGIIRAFGMSTKTVAGGKLAVDHSDVVMVTYNPLHTDELPVLHYAHEKNKGVFIKKAFASGHVDSASALKFIFREPGVSSVIVGTINKTHLAQNAECLEI